MEARPALDDAALAHAAWSVLDANWTGAATVPSPGLYPHQWSWDSGFVAIGLARRHRHRACSELTGLFRGQWASGMLPHIVFQPGERDAYFPGPMVWRSLAHDEAPRAVQTSGITQPPLQAYAVWWIWRYATDPDEARGFVRHVWPCLVAQHDYLARSRNLGGAGLAAIIHPWESGMDNSPSWDAPLGALPAVRHAYRRRDLSDVTPTERPLDDDYDRYIWLAMRFRDEGYGTAYLLDEHPFAVEDPLFNAAWLASTWALGELARATGADAGPYAEAADRIRRALIERLWDPVLGGFFALDLRRGRRIPVRTVGGFGPLLDPGLPREMVSKLAVLLESTHFMGSAGYPVPSCDTRSPEFDRSRYWRGPSWVNTNWLLWRGASLHGLPVLAETLAVATLRMVRQSGFREYFDPYDGTGRGCRDFSWSASLTLDLLASRVGP